MADPNGHRLPSNYYYDDDEEINTVHGNSRQIDTSAATTINTNTSTMNHGNIIDKIDNNNESLTSSNGKSPQKSPITTSVPLTLPDGRIIDGKNTLQSFAVTRHGDGGRATNHPNTSSNGETLSVKPPAFTLPDGRPIDGKNTLQSFAVNDLQPAPTTTHRNPPAQHHPIPSVPPSAVAIAEQQPHIFNAENVSNMEETVAIHAEEVAVREAQVAETHFEPPLHYSKRLLTWFWLLIVIVILAASVGIGIGYCGTGRCGGSTSSSSSSSDDIDTQLMVACAFLNTPNILDCQKLTNFRNDIVGNTIPTEIGLLTQLTYLALFSDDDLPSSIPSTLGLLTRLIELSLSALQITGTIPSTVGLLTQLQFLNLYSNQLTGTIPSSLGRLTELTYLSLSDNQLSGTIPSTLGTLTELTNLFLSNNTFTGTIPSTFGLLTQLIYMQMGKNSQLDGTVPSSLCSAVSDVTTYYFVDCANVTCSCCYDQPGGFDDRVLCT